MEIRSMAVWLSLAATSLPAASAAGEASREPAACEALGDKDEQLLARLPRELIEHVQQLVETHFASPFEHEPPGGQHARLRGATIVVRPVEGLTAQRLHRLVRCGLFRAAAADPRRPTDWPRTPPGTTVDVYPGIDGFIVMLRAEDDAAAEELWRTAQRLEPARVSRAGSR